MSPYAALTPSQRLHLDIFGYVLIENVFSTEEVKRLRETLYAIEARYIETGECPYPSSHFSSTTQECFRVDNLPHIAQPFFDYVTHPRLVAMAEEITGGKVRLEQSDAHIRRPLEQPPAPGQYGFHRGINPGFSYIRNGLFHFTFVKTLTNLTDLEPGDGGTTVIPGTHKITDEVNQAAIVQAAMEDPRLIHEVSAPAGSTLLFYEALIHASGVIRSGKDRSLIIAGYTPTMFQAWHGYDPDAAFLATLSDEHRALLSGERKYGWDRTLRKLETEEAPVS